MSRDAYTAVVVHVLNGSPERPKGRYVHDISGREVAQQVAALIRHLDTRDETESIPTAAV
jgi:hypothetical protein